MQRKITRTQGSRYCTVEIKLSEGRLSISGEEGRIMKPAAARKEAIEYWRSYFDDDPNAIIEMNKRCGKRFTSALSAAKYVVQVDGLDAHEFDDGVYITESCGQITEEIAKWFPEVKPLLPWHLNDMKPGCEHQDALGWGYGKTIALAAHALTEAQRLTIDGNAQAQASKKRQDEYLKRWNEILSNDLAAARAVKAAKGMETPNTVTISDIEDLRQAHWFPRRPMVKRAQEWLKGQIAKEIPVEVFDAAIYKDSLMAPCPVCGYEYGSQWLKRELPAEIIKLAETVLTESWIPVRGEPKE
jgi:hypothetical protein